MLASRGPVSLRTGVWTLNVSVNGNTSVLLAPITEQFGEPVARYNATGSRNARSVKPGCDSLMERILSGRYPVLSRVGSGLIQRLRRGTASTHRCSAPRRAAPSSGTSVLETGEKPENTCVNGKRRGLNIL